MPCVKQALMRLYAPMALQTLILLQGALTCATGAMARCWRHSNMQALQHTRSDSSSAGRALYLLRWPDDSSVIRGRRHLRLLRRGGRAAANAAVQEPLRGAS